MATRTPPLQLRSQFGRDWGNYADGVISLPNQSSNVLNATQPVLEVGDRAFASSRVWECLDPGTVGGGDAVWRPVGPDILDTVEGFSLADYYEAPLAVAVGGASFSAVWYGYFVDFVEGAGQYLMGHSSGALNGGWSLSVGGRSGSSDPAVIEALVIEAGPSLVGVNENVAQPAVWHRARPLHVALAYATAGAGLETWIDGVRTRFSPSPSGAAFLPSPTGRFKVGLGGFFGNEPALNQGFIGGGYIDGAALTAAQVQEHLQACRDEGFAFAAGALAWTHRWDVRTAQALGGIATLPDLGGGGGNLTAVGAPAARARRV